MGDKVGDGDSSSQKFVVGGKNVVLKVGRDENFVMPSMVNPCLKYSIFTLCYLLLLFSIGLLALGIWAQTDKFGILFSLKKFDPKNAALFLDPTILMFLTSVIIIIISFCGTVGSLRDNCFYLMLYTCMLGFMIITYLMLIIMAVFIGRALLNVVETTIEDTIILYRDEPDLQLLVDWIQINAKCCGAFSPHDWNNNIYFSDASILRTYGSLEAGGVPFSCCKETKSTMASLSNMYCGLNARKSSPLALHDKSVFLREDIHQEGCIEMIKKFLIDNMLYIAPAFFIFFVIHLFCLFSACILQNQIFEQQEEWYSTGKLKLFVYDQ
ncbi:transmembrane 4 superfamily member 9 [Loa loa]|uniref:Transmembrane 4 superfamily member 9 n=2 Tax=Loa loa TaxID=7209 RepID=A0A1S0UC55_LOALO|nr:transmembrane 4 superfamily member 9 [Loa loa]EFO28430.1 transmembrane 4 superfamily member 9 [Loa loa]